MDRGRKKGRDEKGKQALNTNELTHIKHALSPLLPSPLSPDQCLSHTLLLSFAHVFAPSLAFLRVSSLNRPACGRVCRRHNLLVITAYWNKLIERKGERVAVCLRWGSGNTVTAGTAAALMLHRGAGESREKTARHQQLSGRFSHLFNHHLI